MTQMTTCDLHNETIIRLQRDLAASEKSRKTLENLLRETDEELAAANAERDKWKASHSFYSFHPHFLTGTACTLCGAEHATYAESHECAIVSATDLKKKVKRTEFLFRAATGYTVDEYTAMIKEVAEDKSETSLGNLGGKDHIANAGKMIAAIAARKEGA